MSGIVNSTGAVSGVIGTMTAPAVGTGTDGYVLTATGAGVNPAWEAAAGGGGGLAHIVTADMPDAVTTGSLFDDFYSASYTSYYVVLRDIEIDTDATEFQMQFNQDSDQTVEAGANYWTSVNGFNSNNGGYTVGMEQFIYMLPCPNLGTATGEVFNGHFMVSGMQNTSVFASIVGSGGWNHGGDYIVSLSFAAQYHGNAATLFSGFTLLTNPHSSIQPPCKWAGGKVSVYGHTTS